MAVRRITEQEIQQMNTIIRPKYGCRLQIISGTYEKEDNCTAKYHLVIGDPINKIPHLQLFKIGESLKKEWDSSVEYYNFGVKIA